MIRAPYTIVLSCRCGEISELEFGILPDAWAPHVLPMLRKRLGLTCTDDFHATFNFGGLKFWTDSFTVYCLGRK